jgi:hypothetical protein
MVSVEQTRNRLSELETSISEAKAEIKQDVLAEVPKMPDVPSQEEIRLQVEEVAAQQTDEVQTQANSAQSLAIVALIAGVAGIAAGLLFQ